VTDSVTDSVTDFFESCYDQEKKTLDFPIQWIQVSRKVGDDNFIQMLNNWIEENKIPLPDIGHSREDAIKDFQKLIGVGALTPPKPLMRREGKGGKEGGREGKWSDSNYSGEEEYGTNMSLPLLSFSPWTHFLDYNSPPITFSLANFPNIKQEMLSQEVQQPRQNMETKKGGSKGGVPPSLLIGISLSGNACTHYFNTPYRMKTQGLKNKSVEQIWGDKVCRRRALNMLKTKAKYNRSVNSAAFLNILMNYGCSATNFKPSVAKTIYQMFGAKKIYDFSAGWGDRLIAALATPGVELYVGTDPNTNNHPLYDSILKTLDEPSEQLISQYKIPNSNNSQRRTEACLHFLRAEDFYPAEIYGQNFDLVFTSCPYFNLEQYAAKTDCEDDQCWKKYPEVEMWLNKFLFAALQNAIDCLRPGGILAINIADFVKTDKRTKLCEPMNRFLLSTKSCDYCGCIGMKLHKRYGNYIKDKSGVHAEPIWIWRKNLTAASYA
jgi:hypothetical protein